MEQNQVKPSKVLVVDDNPKNIQVIANILDNAGYSVGYATNGQQAICTLQNTNDYDLVLMDIDMPVLNGMEACKLIRSNQKLIHIPVIFLTAFTDTEKIVAGFEAGAQDYITKPFNSHELLARVKTHIELKKNREILLNINVYLEEQVIQRTEELTIANEKLDKANAQLKQLDQAKNEFIHILSHEIRTPLNGILGSLDLLKLNSLPEKTNFLLEMLDKSAKRLEKFSFQTLDISNLRINGAQALTVSEVNLNKLIRECIANLKKETDSYQLSFTRKADVGEIKGDKDLILKSFNILLENAIKHSGKNTSISIETEKYNGKLVIKVVDDGKGFKKEVLENPFSPFSTGKEHINKNIGLDLYFVKLVMDAHAGEIEIGNNSGGGGFVKLMFKI